MIGIPVKKQNIRKVHTSHGFSGRVRNLSRCMLVAFPRSYEVEDSSAAAVYIEVSRAAHSRDGAPVLLCTPYQGPEGQVVRAPSPPGVLSFITSSLLSSATDDPACTTQRAPKPCIT